MRSWAKNNTVLFLAIILAATAFLYHDSFNSRFFQDDKTELGLARTGNYFAATSYYPYRPVSIQIFYSLGDRLSGNNPLAYHLLEFAAFAGTVVLVFAMTGKILGDREKGLIAACLYSFNISLFALFYWIATAYFSLGALFILLAAYLYCFTPGKLKWLSVPAFVLAVGSNEIALVLPVLLTVTLWYLKKLKKDILVFYLLSAVLSIIRIAVAGIPKASDYTLRFNLSFFSDLRWYLLRALNLPEGVNRTGMPFVWISFAVFIFSLGLFVFRYLCSNKINFRLFVLGAVWFFFGALPFYFLPGHMSSYYLTIALFGIVIIIPEVFPKKGVLPFICLAAYILLSAAGLEFLKQTHWIILKNTGPIGKF